MDGVISCMWLFSLLEGTDYREICSHKMSHHEKYCWILVDFQNRIKCTLATISQLSTDISINCQATVDRLSVDSQPTVIDSRPTHFSRQPSADHRLTFVG